MGIVKNMRWEGKQIFKWFCIQSLKYCVPLRNTAFSRKTFGFLFLFSCKNIFPPYFYVTYLCSFANVLRKTLQSLIKIFAFNTSGRIAQVLWENTEAYIVFSHVIFLHTIRGSVNVHLIFKTTYKLPKLNLKWNLQQNLKINIYFSYCAIAFKMISVFSVLFLSFRNSLSEYQSILMKLNHTNYFRPIVFFLVRQSYDNYIANKEYK